jgi:hypothetical protein
MNGMIERREDAPHPIEREIDQLGMQRQKPRDDGINFGHCTAQCATILTRR